MSAWWTGIPAAAATLDCGGHSHALRWQRGTLTAVDHDEIEAEATLAALARETVPCLERVRAWNRYRDDVRVLALASRGVTDRLDLAAEPSRHPRAPLSQGEDGALLELLSLGGGLPDRLQAHAAAAWAERLRTGHAGVDQAGPKLLAALYGRLLATLRVWLDAPQLAIELTMVDQDGPRRLERHGDTVAVELPFVWLAEVWARGLTTIAGRLCLAASTDDGLDWTLVTLAPDLNSAGRLSLRIG